MVRVFVAIALLVGSLIIAGPALAFPGTAMTEAAMTSPTMTNAYLVAQTPEISADTIAKFAKAYQSIQVIRLRAEEDMADAVEAAGLSVEEFNAIAQSKIEAGDDPTSEVADNPKFKSAVDAIIAIRQEAEEKMEGAIVVAGIAVEDFNQILEQSADDTDLQRRISNQLTQ